MVSFPYGVTSWNLECPMATVNNGSRQVENATPSVKLCDSCWGVGSEDTENVDEESLPHSKLKLMEQIHCEQ